MTSTSGGSIVFKVDTNKNTLLDLRYIKQIRAKDGENGKTNKMSGASSDDEIIYVPLGTIIKDMSNDEIIAEYEEVLSRDHFHISLAKRQTLFEYIRRKGTTAERVISNKIFIDETDRVFYEVTLSKEDSFLVTGNLKHYPKEPRVVTPAERLEILEKD